MISLLRPALVGSVLGLLLGGAVLLFVPQQFEATGSIKLGHVDGQPIESSAISAQRLRTYALQERIAVKLGLHPEDARLFRESLWANPRASEPMLDVRVRAFDRDRARALFDEMAASLSAAHAEISTADLARRAAALQQARLELRNADAFRAEFERSAAATSRPKTVEQVGEAAAAKARVLNDRDAQRLVLQATIQRLEEGLVTSRTFPTAVIDAPNVPERAVFPKPLAFLTAGATLGALLGIAFGAFRRNVSL